MERLGRRPPGSQAVVARGCTIGASEESLGDAKKASSFYIMGQDISAKDNATNVNKLPSEVEFSVVGPVKDGQDVSVTSKGSDTVGKNTLAWDLKLKAKVLAVKN